MGQVADGINAPPGHAICKGSKGSKGKKPQVSFPWSFDFKISNIFG
jgi:hypothetical protein